MLGTHWRLLPKHCPLSCHLRRGLSSVYRWMGSTSCRTSHLPGSPVNQICGLFPRAQPCRHWPHGFAILTCGKGWCGFTLLFVLSFIQQRCPLLSLLGRSLGSSVALMEDSSKEGGRIFWKITLHHLCRTSVLCLLPLFLWQESPVFLERTTSCSFPDVLVGLLFKPSPRSSSKVMRNMLPLELLYGLGKVSPLVAKNFPSPSTGRVSSHHLWLYSVHANVLGMDSIHH